MKSIGNLIDKKIGEKVKQVHLDAKVKVEAVKADIKQSKKELSYKSIPTIKKLIMGQFGYPYEKHTYCTQDGHINTVYRIPGPKSEKNTIGLTNRKIGKPVVIYQHGILDCCVGIIAAGEESLGLRLVNQGYDLWINNSRGNRYSQDHQEIDVDHMSTKDKACFFDFSFYEMGKYDQPALWEYVEFITGQKKVAYIGHSQGTTQLFSAMTENPQFFSERCKVFIALAPVVSLKNLQCQIVKKYQTQIMKVLKPTGPEILDQASSGNIITNALSSSILGGKISNRALQEASDGDVSLINDEAYKTHSKFFPAGSSFKCMEHYQQLLNNGGEFRKFDYGPEINLLKYDSEEAPKLDLQNISGVKIAMICGHTDLLASPADYLWLKKELGRCQNVDLIYKEYPNGHQGLIYPSEPDSTDAVIKIIVECDKKPQDLQDEKKVEEEQKVQDEVLDSVEDEEQILQEAQNSLSKQQIDNREQWVEVKKDLQTDREIQF